MNTDTLVSPLARYTFPLLTTVTLNRIYSQIEGPPTQTTLCFSLSKFIHHNRFKLIFFLLKQSYKTIFELLCFYVFLHSPREVWGAREWQAGLWLPPAHRLHSHRLTAGSGWRDRGAVPPIPQCCRLPPLGSFLMDPWTCFEGKSIPKKR